MRRVLVPVCDGGEESLFPGAFLEVLDNPLSLASVVESLEVIEHFVPVPVVGLPELLMRQTYCGFIDDFIEDFSRGWHFVVNFYDVKRGSSLKFTQHRTEPVSKALFLMV